LAEGEVRFFRFGEEGMVSGRKALLTATALAIVL